MNGVVVAWRGSRIILWKQMDKKINGEWWMSGEWVSERTGLDWSLWIGVM